MIVVCLLKFHVLLTLYSTVKIAEIVQSVWRLATGWTTEGSEFESW
jgi:hypothetical protein